ncbi:MAG TPA: sigma-70 family RNA polymerase sigma factor [Polyangiaceae bacterium]|nr:sigma-70 family RNA polymerase sigma factor [Polyangiaceae bacterium]
MAGNDAARFSQLVSEHLDFLWRALRRFGVREADVDDATQRVFLIANEKLPRIEVGRERSFLVGVATRIAAHARRSYQRRDVAEGQLSTSPPADNPNPEELTQQLQARMLLDRVLDKMPEELRIVFVLFELEELTVDEITHLLGLPRGTVATRLRRSREVFHDCARSVAAERSEGRKNG